MLSKIRSEILIFSFLLSNSITSNSITLDIAYILRESALNGFRANYIEVNDDINKTILFLSQLKYSSPIGIALNYECFNSDAALSTAVNQRYFSPSFKWLVYEHNGMESVALRQLETAHLFMNADISYVNLGMKLEDERYFR